jgi:hypothetical protein
LHSDQTSNYNALQVSASKSLSRGFTVNGFYVWSRALESGEFVENGEMTGAQDYGYFGHPFTPQNNSMGAVGGGLKEEYQPMANNRDGNAALSGMWTPNYFHGSNKIAKGALNGWTISSIAYFQAGLPFTVLTGSNLNFDSKGNSRPNFTGVNPKLDAHRCRLCGGYTGGQSANTVTGEWFNSTFVKTNTTIAAAQAAGQSYIVNGPGQEGGIGPGGADGNVRRGSLIGPGLKDMDAGLLRDVNIEGKMVFQFRFEVTNVMNWVSLANPTSGNITTGSQGTITGANGTQRIMQLGGRLTF